MASPRFAEAMRSMRAGDPRRRADAFDFLREHADAYVDDLLAEFAAEGDDHELRCLLLELISETRSPSALPTLAGQLENDDDRLRMWAIRGLEMLDTREAEQALDHARSTGLIM